MSNFYSSSSTPSHASSNSSPIIDLTAESELSEEPEIWLQVKK